MLLPRLGYTVGRVPMNSCDFSVASYNFDNVTGDVDLLQYASAPLSCVRCSHGVQL